MENKLKKYNVLWTSPSKDCTGAMPIGNGDIAAVVYAIENGSLYLLLSKNDAFNYCGDIYKTGRIKIDILPCPFKAQNFRQVLDIYDGRIKIEASGVDILIWVDANNSVYNIEIKSDAPVSVTAEPEFWERLDGTKDRCKSCTDNILWYFPVGDKSSYPDALRTHSIENMERSYPDPYRFNTFGNLMKSEQMMLDENGKLAGNLAGGDNNIIIRVFALCMKTTFEYDWITEITKLAARKHDYKSSWKSHIAWWHEFWEKSYIFINDTEKEEPTEESELILTTDGYIESENSGALVAQNYMVFRFLMACQSRGYNQTKFNGGLFTQQFHTKQIDNRFGIYRSEDGTFLTHEDDRLWGSRYTFQNQRHLYWPTLMNGDFDLIKPFFNYYARLLDMRIAVNKAWFGHAGAYYRENVQPTGVDLTEPDGMGTHPPKTKRGEPYEGWYHDYYFTASLEIVAMMLEYYRYTNDTIFKDDVLLPFAKEILTFYDKHTLQSGRT